MSIHPTNDRFKVLVSKDEYGFGGETKGTETGIVVEVPDMMIYLSFHSFAFEHSIVDDKLLKKVNDYYKQFLGMRIFWESLQDRGRRFKEGDNEYVFLQMTDLLAYADSADDESYVINQTGKAGSFNLE